MRIAELKRNKSHSMHLNLKREEKIHAYIRFETFKSNAE